jgi:hypothetical protein
MERADREQRWLLGPCAHVKPVWRPARPRGLLVGSSAFRIFSDLAELAQQRHLQDESAVLRGTHAMQKYMQAKNLADIFRRI